jgi:acetyltransferase-like isoleucine patch superfamily enzyme
MRETIISPHTRIRHPHLFQAGPHSVVDDFCYFSTRVEIGAYCHIASGCSIAGGKEWLFALGDFCSLSSGVKVWCTSNDYVNDLIIIAPDGCDDVAGSSLRGDVMIGRYCGVGANAVIMPGNSVPEGVAIGALSYVPPAFHFDPWTVYAGVPVKPLKPRNRNRVLQQIEEIERRMGSGVTR